MIADLLGWSSTTRAPVRPSRQAGSISGLCRRTGYSLGVRQAALEAETTSLFSDRRFDVAAFLRSRYIFGGNRTVGILQFFWYSGGRPGRRFFVVLVFTVVMVCSSPLKTKRSFPGAGVRNPRNGIATTAVGKLL